MTNTLTATDAMHWYALRTVPQKEFVSELLLRKSGHHAFVPTETKLRRKHAWSKERVAVPYPMFTGYVFAGFRQKNPWYELRRYNVITGVVGSDGRPQQLNGEAVQHLMRVSGVAVPFSRSINPHRSFRIGDTVEVVNGPFRGNMVKLRGITKRKARILLELFGTIQDVEIPLEQLEAA